MSLPAPYYQDNAVTIYHGDCREILPRLSNGVNLLLTDPPYSISVKGGNFTRTKGKGTRRYDFFAGDDDRAVMDGVVQYGIGLAVNLLAENASAYIWCSHRQFGNMVNLLEESGFKTRPISWIKACPCPAPPGSGWPAGFEMAVYGYKPGRYWPYGAGHGPKSSALVFDSYRFGQPGKVDHPTQKPIGLFNTLIEASCPVGGGVLDPFMGSGTSLRCAKDLGRKAIGIEIEEAYCEIAAKRMSQGVLAL